MFFTFFKLRKWYQIAKWITSTKNLFVYKIFNQFVRNVPITVNWFAFQDMTENENVGVAFFDEKPKLPEKDQKSAKWSKFAWNVSQSESIGLCWKYSEWKNLWVYFIVKSSLTNSEMHFLPMFPFIPPENTTKTFGFRMFSREIKEKHSEEWLKRDTLLYFWVSLIPLIFLIFLS